MVSREQRCQQAECNELTSAGSNRGDGAFCRLCCDNRPIRLLHSFAPREKETGFLLPTGVEFPEVEVVSSERLFTSLPGRIPSVTSSMSIEVSGLEIIEAEDRIVLIDLNADMRRCRVPWLAVFSASCSDHVQT